MKYSILIIALSLLLISCEERKEITFQDARKCAQACQELGKGYMSGYYDQSGQLMCQCWYW